MKQIDTSALKVKTLSPTKIVKLKPFKLQRKFVITELNSPDPTLLKSVAEYLHHRICAGESD